MTNEEKRAEIVRIVTDFTKEYIERRLLWQAGQIVPGADVNERLTLAYNRLFSEPLEEAIKYTMEPQQWLEMALFGAGVIDANADEMREVCQSLAEWLFAIPGSYHYEIPDFWAETPLGALWWQAIIRSEGDELVTIAEAAKIAGRSVQAISARVDRGTMRSFTDPFAHDRQGRRLVRMSDAAMISTAVSQQTVRIHGKIAGE